MTARKPPDAAKLLAYVQKFIKKHEISCPEAVSQCDAVILDAYAFIEGCCRIAGYHKEKP